MHAGGFVAQDEYPRKALNMEVLFFFKRVTAESGKAKPHSPRTPREDTFPTALRIVVNWPSRKFKLRLHPRN